MENEKVILEYLQGKLNEEQERDFQERLETDEHFFQEYTMLKQMHSYLRERENREEYTKELDHLGSKYFSPEAEKAIPNTKKYLSLIIIAILAIITIWYLLTPKEIDLYDTHADHFALHLVLKSDANTIAVNAENAFNQGRFEMAILELNKYLEANQIDTKARLALGISHLEAGNNKEAMEIFEEISEGSSTLKDYGTWYKALYYAKNSDFTNARKAANSIPVVNKQLYEKAQKLLEDIDKKSSKQEQ